MGFQRFPIVVAGSSAELKFSSAGRDGAKIERKLRLRQNGGEEENEADVKGSEGIHTIGAVRALLSVRERYGAAGKAWQAKKAKYTTPSILAAFHKWSACLRNRISNLAGMSAACGRICG